MQSRVSFLCQPQSRLALFRLIPQISLAPLSTSARIFSYDGKPPSSGDRGRREKNFRRNQQKKERARTQREAKVVDTQALLKGMREMEGQRDGQHKTNMESLKDILAGIKFHVPTNEETRKQLGMRPKGSSWPDGEEARLSSERLPEHSMHPSAGPRLGIFNAPNSEESPVLAAPPNLAQRHLAHILDTMRLLKPTNQFEINMTDVRYPRKFPIDNEADNVDDDIGFEEHVLLNHLLKDFSTRGPVRHFMEMVVTGLSKNPDYTAQEKRDYVQWYRDYFSQFSDEDLQSLASTTTTPQ